jgi:CRP-like cAMP-binding protein
MMHTQGAEQRLAHLAEILQSFSIGMNELTHERIALLTGLTRGTVTRALGVLEKSSESELKSDITDPTSVGLFS